MAVWNVSRDFTCDALCELAYNSCGHVQLDQVKEYVRSELQQRATMEFLRESATVNVTDLEEESATIDVTALQEE